MPPGEDMEMVDFVDYAKFALCKNTNTLWKDPIWDQYTTEDILVEYFAYLFTKDEELKREFEISIDANAENYGEIYDWLDQKVAENQEEMQRELDELPDNISFSPDTIGDD